MSGYKRIMKHNHGISTQQKTIKSSKSLWMFIAKTRKQYRILLICLREKGIWVVLFVYIIIMLLNSKKKKRGPMSTTDDNISNHISLYL